jgi:hypothetical protein
MTRVVVGPLAILLLAAGWASAQDAGPPLDGPSLLPPGAKPADAPSTPPLDAPAEPEGPPRRPLLVIPGVTAPSAVAGRFNRQPAPARASEATKTPSLSGPAVPVESIPLTLEPIPAGDAEVGVDAPGRARTTPPPAEGKPRSTSGDPAAPRYTPGSMLGRFLGSGDGSDARNAIRVESRSDPAVDAAVKRKVEQKIQETLGDRVKSVEVRVTGRTVSIRARASRFWHRRGVRRTLETLALPAGYRARVEGVD